MKPDEIKNLHERLQALEGVLAHVVGVLAHNPTACAKLQHVRDGLLVGLAKHARPGPIHPQQQDMAEALHAAYTQLFRNLPPAPSRS